MRRTIKIPASNPRNHVVIVLALLARIGSDHEAGKKHQKNSNQNDLAQRVREVGA